jgi:hypothetical protein
MTTGQPTLPGVEVPAIGDSLDFWETPAWATRIILPHLPMCPTGRWCILEPAAGRGAMIDPLLDLQPRCIGAIEIHRGRFEHLAHAHRHIVMAAHGDFLTMDVRAEFPAIFEDDCTPLLFGNPPFSKPRPTIGLDVVEKALELAAPRGCVAMLLPLDYAAGQERAKRLHDKYAGSLYPLRRRPEFGNDATGMRPLAWFVWDLANPKREFRVL